MVTPSSSSGYTERLEARGSGGEIELAAHGFRQRLAGERLRHERGRRVVGRLAADAGRIAGHEHRRDGSSALAKALGQLGPSELGHHQVADEEVERPAV